MKNRHGSGFIRIILLILALALLFSGCSIKKIALRQVSNMLTSGEGSPFQSDEDPELIGEALPFALKLYESLLQASPDDPALCLGTAKAALFYSSAYLQTPAEQMPDTRLDESQALLKRSQKLYLRAYKYIIHGLEIRRSGFSNAYRDNRLDDYLKSCTKADAPYLYWAGMAWMGAYTTDKFDMKVSIQTPKAVAMIRRVLELDERMDGGAPDEFFISYYGSLPVSMGGSEKKAREHFNKALSLSRGTRPGVYIALATTVCVNRQDAVEYRELLGKALDIDIEKDPANRTINILAQRKARWLFDHVDNVILDNGGSK